jgi:hypothetical protein
MGAMKTKSHNGTVVVIDWNAEGGRLENIKEEDWLNLARALGRLAARRDLAQIQKDRARSKPRADVQQEQDGVDAMGAAAPASPAE